MSADWNPPTISATQAMAYVLGGRPLEASPQPAAKPEHYQAQVEQLVADMAAAGLVLTVEQQPLQPLAMGNYRTVVSVRRARGAG